MLKKVTLDVINVILIQTLNILRFILKGKSLYSLKQNLSLQLSMQLTLIIIIAHLALQKKGYRKSKAIGETRKWAFFSNSTLLCLNELSHETTEKGKEKQQRKTVDI